MYWKIFEDGYLASRNVTITSYNAEISGAASAESGIFVERAGDGCDAREYSDNSFDLVHTNSTIEHVGDWGRMESFAREVRRLAPVYYVQTPYYWFPVEPHVLLPVVHWMPEGVRAKIYLHTGLAAYGSYRTLGEAMQRVQSARLLDRAQMTYLFPDSVIRFEWFGPLPKSVIAVREPAGA